MATYGDRAKPFTIFCQTVNPKNGKEYFWSSLDQVLYCLNFKFISQTLMLHTFSGYYFKPTSGAKFLQGVTGNGRVIVSNKTGMTHRFEANCRDPLSVEVERTKLEELVVKPKKVRKPRVVKPKAVATFDPETREVKIVVKPKRVRKLTLEQRINKAVKKAVKVALAEVLADE